MSAATQFEQGANVRVKATEQTERNRLAGRSLFVGETLEENGVPVARLFLRRELAMGGRDWDGVRMPTAILPLDLLELELFAVPAAQFPNVRTVRAGSADGPVLRVFVDRWDPEGRDAQRDAERWIAEQMGEEIDDQPPARGPVDELARAEASSRGVSAL